MKRRRSLNDTATSGRPVRIGWHVGSRAVVVAAALAMIVPACAGRKAGYAAEADTYLAAILAGDMPPANVVCLAFRVDAADVRSSVKTARSALGVGGDKPQALRGRPDLLMIRWYPESNLLTGFRLCGVGIDRRSVPPAQTFLAGHFDEGAETS